MIRTRGIQLPKLALYQAELRPDHPNVAISKEFGNGGDSTEPGQTGPKSPGLGFKDAEPDEHGDEVWSVYAVTPQLREGGW